MVNKFSQNKVDDLTARQQRDFATLYQYLNLETDLPPQADAIIVGGNNIRIDMAQRAVELYKLGYAPLMVMSGFRHPQTGRVEADLLADYAIQAGVPAEVILRESRATNTGLNIQLSAELLCRQASQLERVVLVHKPYMTRRFLATAQAQWPGRQPQFFVTSCGDSFVEYLQREEEIGLAQDTLRLLLKDYMATQDYPKRGFMTPQPYDAAVEAAYRRLLRDKVVPLHIEETTRSTHYFIQADS